MLKWTTKINDESTVNKNAYWGKIFFFSRVLHIARGSLWLSSIINVISELLARNFRNFSMEILINFGHKTFVVA